MGPNSLVEYMGTLWVCKSRLHFVSGFAHVILHCSLREPRVKAGDAQSCLGFGDLGLRELGFSLLFMVPFSSR